MIHPQIPLPFNPSEPPGFNNFSVGENGLAANLMVSLRDSRSVRQIYLWGGGHCGKSHLLLATHRQWLAAGQRSFYASLADNSLPVSLIDELDFHDLVVLDDIHYVAHKPDWEMALFNLINFSREGATKLIFGSRMAPSPENWGLPDLASRLAWGPVLKLQELADEDIREAMLAAARQRGMQFDVEAANYLLTHYPRDLMSLLQAVATLDTESIAAGRARITIPFLKRCLTFD
ncbi:DnaA regulatory inactivator Hda [Chromatiales bacterium (ex Bugula neritina AB1)]|nr:DnaA regulatory inactivator Hda [Chromatiales bacterium (ex Bugula neritina AB1)]